MQSKHYIGAELSVKRMSSTHIRVSKRTWKALNRLKNPGDDFDDVCKRLTNNTINDPGLYLINSTGEAHALSTESGDGDKQLLKEVLSEHGIDVDNE